MFANGVLLHFTRVEFGQAVRKVYNALKPGGTFAFSVKQGEGEKWSNGKLGAPRFFCDWTETQLRGVLGKVGYNNIEVTVSRVDGRSQEWLLVVAGRP